MKLKKIHNKESKISEIVIEINGEWRSVVNKDLSLLDILNLDSSNIKALRTEAIENIELCDSVIPINPVAYRDFMLYEKHAINAARGFVKKYMANLFPIVTTYEKIFRKPFPKLKPKKDSTNIRFTI